MVADMIGPFVELLTFATRATTAGALAQVGGKGSLPPSWRRPCGAARCNWPCIRQGHAGRMEADLVIAAVPLREDVRDVLVGPPGGLDGLPNGRGAWHQQLSP